MVGNFNPGTRLGPPGFFICIKTNNFKIKND